jgi:hypothetical protein
MHSAAFCCEFIVLRERMNQYIGVNDIGPPVAIQLHGSVMRMPRASTHV